MPDKEIEQIEKEKQEKEKSGNSKILAWILIVVAILTAILGLVMFSQTIGTKLLYMDVVLGRIFRYYWIILLIAFVLLSVGIFILKKKKNKNPIAEQQEKTTVEESIEAETEVTEVKTDEEVKQ